MDAQKLARQVASRALSLDPSSGKPRRTANRIDEGVRQGYVDVEAIKQKYGYTSSAPFVDAAWKLMRSKGKVFVKGTLDPKARENWERRLAVSIGTSFVIEDEGQFYGLTEAETDELYRQHSLAYEVEVKLDPVRGRTGQGYRVVFNNAAKELLKLKSIRIASDVPF